MTSWRQARAAEVRQRLTAVDEGSLWMLLLDDPGDAPIVATAGQDAMAHMDSQMTRNLAYIIDEVPANAALLVIPRRDGIP